MAKAQRTGSKQRKSRDPNYKPGGTPVVEINERQVVSDTMATSGEFGIDAVARISDWLQANGKIILPIILIGLIAVVVLIFRGESEAREQGTFGAALMTATGQKELKDLHKGFEDLKSQIDFKAAESGEAEEALRASDYYYRYATSLFSVAAQDTDLSSNEKKLDKENDKVVELINAYLAVAEKADPAFASRSAQLIHLRDKEILAKRNFKSDPNSAFLDSSTWEGKVTEPAMVEPVKDSGVYPEVVFSTSRGEFTMKLFDNADPEARTTDPVVDGVKLVVALVERGYYDRIDVNKLVAPNLGNQSDLAFKGSSFVSFGDRGRLMKLPDPNEKKDEEKKEEADADADADEKEEKPQVMQPYFTLPTKPVRRGGAVLAKEFRHEAGRVFLYQDAAGKSPLGPSLGISLQDNDAMFSGRYQVIGEISEGGMDVVRALRPQDKIYKAWVKQLYKGMSYVPNVIFVEGADRSGIPQPWLKEPLAFIPPEIAKPESAEMVDSSTNPVVWIRTDKGDMEVELFEDVAPNTVKNFIYLVEQGHYKGSDFHVVGLPAGQSGQRYIQGGRKVVESGAKDENGKLISRDEFDWTIKNEAVDEDYRLNNIRGTIAMFHGGDKDSAGCQFLINLKPDESRDDKKNPTCVFGRVISNLAVADEIRKDDKIVDMAVKQKRKDTTYVPLVRFKDKSDYVLASEKKAS